ncbi:hypothetical protein V6N13_033211 [Hibiscus sabdariffa]
MVGSQALVAYRMSDVSMRAYTSPIAQYRTQLREGAISGNVPQMPGTSGANIQSMGTLNLISGEGGTIGEGSSRQRKQKIHGVLNAVSWGILMPLGAITARYLKVFKSADPAWFYLHASCQFSAYVVGVAGWGTGLKLGSESPGIQYNAHRTIGIILLYLGTPKPDQKLRFYWNIYHHLVGYGVINIFKGFDILGPEKKWKNAYVGVIIALACNTVMLEAYTWFFVQRKRSQLSLSSLLQYEETAKRSGKYDGGEGRRPSSRRRAHKLMLVENLVQPWSKKTKAKAKESGSSNGLNSFSRLRRDDDGGTYYYGVDVI